MNNLTSGHIPVLTTSQIQSLTPLSLRLDPSWKSFESTNTTEKYVKEPKVDLSPLKEISQATWKPRPLFSKMTDESFFEPSNKKVDLCWGQVRWVKTFNKTILQQECWLENPIYGKSSPKWVEVKTVTE